MQSVVAPSAAKGLHPAVALSEAKGLHFAVAFAVALALSTTPLPAQRRAPVPSAALVRLDSALERAVTAGDIPGGVLLVLRDGKPAYQRAVGWADREAGRRMTPTTLFRIASQTKALTSAAILMLIEEGKIGLGTPVGRIIPAFAKTTVAIKTDTGRAIIPATRAITIRDLLTHTSGYSYGSDSLVASLYAAKGLGPVAGYGGWYLADRDEDVCTTMSTVGSLPAVSQPGEKWVYGYNTDILGCVVEKVSGQRLDAFFAERLTGPLGMKDTHFWVNPADRDRLAAVYASGEDGKVARAPDGARGQGHYVDGPRRDLAGGAGLISTAADYARFLEMIRNGGTLGGKRYLSPRSVALMRTNLVGALYRADGTGGWGLAFEVVQRLDGYRSIGSYGWGGAYGSNYYIDPDNGLTVVWMMQVIPSRAQLPGILQALVAQAFVER